MQINDPPTSRMVENAEAQTREEYLTYQFTGRSAKEVLNEYTLPELLRLQAILVFYEGLPI